MSLYYHCQTQTVYFISYRYKYKLEGVEEGGCVAWWYLVVWWWVDGWMGGWVAGWVAGWGMSQTNNQALVPSRRRGSKILEQPLSLSEYSCIHWVEDRDTTEAISL